MQRRSSKRNTFEGITLRVGIIGCGGIAPSHIEAYRSLRKTEIASLCDLNPDRARDFATKYGIKRFYSDYFEMFEKEKLELVDVCTPVSTHRQIVCDAAKSVPAIMVEKPMALSVKECDLMLEEVKKSGGKLCIGHNQRFSPFIQKARSIVQSSDFDLHSFRTTLKGSFERLKAFNLAPAWNVLPDQKGIIWEVCCHHAYLQLHFLPHIQEVYAVGGKVRYPVYDSFAVLLRTKDRRFGLIEISWLSHEAEVVYEWGDSAGRRIQLYWDFDYMLENSEDHPFTVSDVAKNFLVDEKRLLHKWARFGIAHFRKRRLLPTFNLISSFVESIEKDLQPPVPPEEGRNTIKLLECIQRSLDERQPAQFS
jgi:UDP-N-acetyl-2-amino-2-deoxyglucuronate dehydrogenase